MMKRLGQRGAFFLRGWVMVGGAGLGISLVKLWYLHAAVNQAECAAQVLDGVEYIAFVLIDVTLALLLGRMLWNGYQRKQAWPLAQVAETLRRATGQSGSGFPKRTPRADEDVQDVVRATETALTRVHALVSQVAEVGRAMLDTSQTAFLTSKQHAVLFAEQAGRSKEMASVLQELALSARQISAEGHEAAEAASCTIELAEQGQKTVAAVEQSMEEIRQAFQRSAEKVLTLGRQSEQMHEVVAAIDRMIADTRLIAFNATIEAARAREEGRGFGVVAIEIKRLAEEVGESTEDMKEVIHEIQRASSLLVLGAEEDLRVVALGGRRAEQARDTLARLATTATRATESATRMALAAQQHIIASEQAAQTVEAANQAVRQWAQESKQVTAAAAELSVLAEGLQRVLVGFGAQGVWEQRS